MWSIANKGFPPDVLLVARLVRLFGRSRHFSLMVAFGEIDVRVHLAGTQTRSHHGMKFVSEYVKQCQLLGQKLRATRVVVTVPFPPGDSFDDALGLPRAGTLAERIDAFRMLRQALAAAVDTTEAGPTTVLLDCTEKLADSVGSLRADLTDDGCHVNGGGARAVRESMQSLPL